MKEKGRRIKGERERKKLILAISVSCLISAVALAESSSEYVKKGWAVLGKRQFEEVYRVTDACIAEFSAAGQELARGLSDFPPKGEENKFQIMNDVATCYFIKGEALMRDGKTEEAKGVFREVISRYPFAQSFDPRGWYWSIKEKSEITLNKLETGRIEEGEDETEAVITKVKLYDPGAEFPVDYSKYGDFKNLETKDYRYVITDPIGLSKAVGEGIYPNTSSLKFDPEYISLRKKLFKIDHWKILNSRDLNTAFYKWNVAPEPPAVKQFYIAEILEKSGVLKSAVKAYYAILVHFPSSYSWTYWHTPWYVGKAALYRLQYLLKQHPELNLKLEGASIRVINGYDNDIRNDIFIVNPGKLRKISLKDKIIGAWDKVTGDQKCGACRQNLGKIVETKGKKIKLQKYQNGDWELRVDDKPFIIKAITYGPTRVGESPDDGTMQNWSTQDLNENGIIDSPYESWVDANNNNRRDADEPAVGDFSLMKKMGVNAIRVYHQPFKLNKKIIRQMYEEYGIYIIIGDFLGKYALDSGADWESGTDYDDPLQQEKMLESVKQMVFDFKDEPGVLIWLLGNENVYGLGCNADKKPESFFKFANRAAQLIKSLDPQKRPVGIASGDTLFLDIFAKNCPDIDIFGTNAYRGRYGFLDIWDEVKRTADKPAMLTEYGAPSYAKGYTDTESQDYQASYHEAAWLDILCNSCGFGAGNAVGGIAFEWLDEWWKAYEPSYHDKKGLFSGPFLDGYMHEEWLGVAGQGDGKNSPYLRQLKKSYYTYQELWSDTGEN